MNDKSRIPGIEFLRIIAMLMIIASHMNLHGVVNNGLLPSGTFADRMIASSLILGNVGVGIFFLITGYFSQDKRRKTVSKKIIADVIFYSLVHVVLIIAIGRIEMLRSFIDFKWDTSTVKILLRTLLTPVTGENWWFVTTYIYLLIFVAPILDKINERMDGDRELLLIGCVLFAALISDFLSTPGMRILQGSGYYLIGKYIRNRYPGTGKSRMKMNRYAGCAALFVIHSILMYIIYNSGSAGLYMAAYTGVTVVICPLLVGMIFTIVVNGEILRGGGKYIYTLAETSFGIYLLHEAVYVRELLWDGIIPMKKFWRSGYYLFYSVLTILGIYIGCFLISFLFIKFLRPVFISFINEIEHRILLFFNVSGTNAGE